MYEALGLPWIPPELREGRGEISGCTGGQAAGLITLSDIKGELHDHSTYSDGQNSLAEMAAAARARGYRYFAFTDHSQSLGITGRHGPADWQRQREELEAVRAQFPDLVILHGAEVEVRADGTLDYPDELLAQMDIVIAAVHVSHRQPREQITQRALNALRNPHVDILAHPSGRLLGRREPSEVDLDQVHAGGAKETGTILEINAHPMRLDLDDRPCPPGGRVGRAVGHQHRRAQPGGYGLPGVRCRGGAPRLGRARKRRQCLAGRAPVGPSEGSRPRCTARGSRG